MIKKYLFIASCLAINAAEFDPTEKISVDAEIINVEKFKNLAPNIIDCSNIQKNNRYYLPATRRLIRLLQKEEAINVRYVKKPYGRYEAQTMSQYAPMNKR